MARRRRSYYDDYWPSFTPSRPIHVEGGIKARSQRGAFVQNWWAERWIKALTRLMDSKRLARGRTYARQGQVREIDIQPGQVTARVQGSRPSPYKVRIQLQPLNDHEWARVLDALAEQAIFAAQLLNGEMPQEIESAFDAVRVPLFPASRGDLVTDCSCPDWANPCKHIAAVYYLLGERFDQDPFLLFTLRGRTQEQIADALRARRAGGMAALHEGGAAYLPEVIAAVESPALAEAVDAYWAIGAEAAQVTVHLSPSEADAGQTPAEGVSMALLKRVGVPDFIGDTKPVRQGFWDQMKRVYEGVTARAIEVAFADIDWTQQAGPDDDRAKTSEVC